jgi:uncharacterized C2H2 Zn-finger protein
VFLTKYLIAVSVPTAKKVQKWLYETFFRVFRCDLVFGKAGKNYPVGK